MGEQVSMETATDGERQTGGHGPRRILGLDAGDRRIGVAVSDELGLTAQPVLTLSSTTLRKNLKALARIARRFGCEAIVLGNPISMSGAPSQRSEKTRFLAEALEREAGIPVHLWDERLSTAEAHRHMDESGRPFSRRREVVDQLAAVLILQSFLDAHRASGDSANGS